MALAYLLDPANQYQNINGVNNVAGWFEVFISDTDERADVFLDFAGTPAPARIGIDMDGRCVMVVDDSKVYRVEMHDRNGVTRWTLYPVWPFGTGGGGGGGGGGGDGDPTVWVSAENPGAAYQYLNEDGDFVLSEGSKSGTGLELVDGMLTVREAGWYHVSANWHVVKGGGFLGEYREVKLLVNGEETGANVDMSKSRDPEYGSWNGDLELDANDTIVFSAEGLDDDLKTAAYLDKVSVHRITKGGGGSSGGGETYSAGSAISITDGMRDDKVISVKLKTNGGLKLYNATLSPDWNSLEVKTDGYSIEVDPNNGALKTVMPVSPYWEPGQFLSVDENGETEWVDVNIPENATVIDFHNDAETFPERPMSDALDALLEKLRNGTASFPVYMRLPAFDGASLSAGARLLQLVEWEYDSPWWVAEMKFSAPNRFYDNDAGTQRYGFEQLEMQWYDRLEAVWHSNRHEFAAFTPTIITLQGV